MTPDLNNPHAPPPGFRWWWGENSARWHPPFVPVLVGHDAACECDPCRLAWWLRSEGGVVFSLPADVETARGAALSWGLRDFRSRTGEQITPVTVGSMVQERGSLVDFFVLELIERARLPYSAAVPFLTRHQAAASR